MVFFSGIDFQIAGLGFGYVQRLSYKLQCIQLIHYIESFEWVFRSLEIKIHLSDFVFFYFGMQF